VAQDRDNGFIYKGTYTGQYCVSDELYIDGIGPAILPRLRTPHRNRQRRNYYLSSPPFRTS